ncbi:MAG: ParA family protein [Kiritimatiellae bacterium]|nr:ParA family protein [Kiritimatiellia bacterium]
MKTPVYALANQKGGVGKTTTAVNLAACLAERGKKILLIDLDPQANATSGLGVEKKEGRSIYSALLSGQMEPDFIQSTAVHNLDLIASETDLAGAEVDIARMDNYLHRLRNVIQPIAEQARYDAILIDCPPSLGILTMNGLTAAQSLIIPIQCEYYALEGLSVINRLITQLRSSGANPDLQIAGIVMTMYDGRTNLAQQVVQEVTRHFGARVFETLIPRTVRLSEAPSFGLPIIAYDKNCTGAAAYRQLAHEFILRSRPSEAPSVSPSPDAPAQTPPAAEPT